MKKNKLVSIIVPVYNVQYWIEECIESILRQSYTNFELLIIDDGSTDNSIKIIKKMINGDNRVKLFQKKNGGQASARNFGMERARGKYIAFIDSDDKVQPDLIESCVQEFNEKNVNIVAFSASILDDDNTGMFESNSYRKTQLEEHVVYNRDDFINKNGIKSSSVCVYLYEFDFLKKHNISFHEGIIHEDVVFWLDILLNKFTISYLDKDFYIRRVRRNSTMTGRNFLKSQEGYNYAATYIKNNILIRQDLSNIQRFFFVTKMVRYYQNTYKGNKVLEILTPLLRGVSLKDYYYVMRSRLTSKILGGE